MEHAAGPLWFTVLLNKLLAAPVAGGLHALGIEVEHPAAPIPDHIAMQVLVLFILFAGAFTLRRRLSVTQPGKFQQVMEVVIQFLRSLVDEIVGPVGRKYLPLLGTIGLFIVVMNLMGLVPGFSTPTAYAAVPFGLSLVVVGIYLFAGVHHHGFLGYMKSLCGPLLVMTPLFFVLELGVPLIARPLSLTARLWANMNVGTVLEHEFAKLVPILVPAIFMGLHVVVAMIQAYIFILLPCVYLGMAVSEEH
ncbi:MAG: F0F1 ATP synthase subunit A [Acidobacteria bacterium]|nr:F0F1 ATP synthase subunit A [Acidobacteriota bacterium]